MIYEEAIVKTAEIIPSGFTDPELLVLSGAIATGAILLDRYKSKREKEVFSEAPPLADPEQAEFVGVSNRITKTRERLAYFLGSSLIFLGTLQMAGPYVSHEKAQGAADVIINADDTGYTSDMTTSNPRISTTRLSASIEGALSAISGDNVPTSIILSGDSTPIAATLPAIGKNMKQASKNVYSLITPTLSNGEEQLPNAVIQATNTKSTSEVNIVMVASRLTSSDIAGIQAEQPTLKANHDQLFGVVVGSDTSANQQIGTATLQAPVDVSSFEQVLGKNNVAQASSASEVQSEVSNFIDSASVSTSEKPIKLTDLGIVLAGLLSATAIRRRLAGLKILRKSKEEGK